MKKVRPYLAVLIGISILVLSIGFLTFRYLYQVAEDKFLQTQMESGQREVREIARLLEQQLKSGLSKQEVINNLQQSILNTDVQEEFICMYNTQGIELCHPNPALVGQVIDAQNSTISSANTKNKETFKTLLNQGRRGGGLRSFADPKRQSEIVNVYPVNQTDWMVASHANISALTAQISALYLPFCLGYVLSSLVIILCSFFLMRLIYRRYDRNMESEQELLHQNINTLSALNEQLRTSQEKLQEELMTRAEGADQPSSGVPDANRKRILTYHRDELVKLDVQEIAYLFLENGITYIRTIDGRQYTSSNSLDDLIKSLDNHLFYRANRQFIVHIRAVKTIFQYGKNQLKLLMEPNSEIDVIISKNKVSEFKQWLDQ